MEIYPKEYDIIVVGAGHAGCEAALAAAGMGCATLLATIDLDKIAAMPCSPSIGGMAKGQLVKEIDALGGAMAEVSDASAIQYHTLNTSKGPAVHSTRTQNDKFKYQQTMKYRIETTDNLDFRQIMVEDLILENGRVKGVVERTGYGFSARAVILATGTFLKGVVHIGSNTIEAGRAGELSSVSLAASLADAGFSLGRMKTGTPPRLHRATIDFSCFSIQHSDPDPRPFSFSTAKIDNPMLPSYIGHTNERSHALVKRNIRHSALYGGKIIGKAARYCPSFEDKVVKFPHRKIHQIILEHEGLHTEEIYASGLGNSLPMELQLEFVHSVKGLEKAEIMRPAYAIEYDFVNPQQLTPTLETKKIKGLFFAGQINGTSGYEEAAGQGLWAGINAACQIQKRNPFILDRSEAYLGVMIDDLVTRGTKEPYRMFTSRAEYRLMLREDNADLRLSEKGYSLGLISKENFLKVCEIKQSAADEKKRIKNSIVKPSPEVNQWLASKNSSPITTGIKMDQILKRAGMDYSAVDALAPRQELPLHPRARQQVEIDLKYEGYILRQLNEIKKFKDMEKIKIPRGLDFKKNHGLSNELKEKLAEINPESLGQASRIEGMTPAAISVLMVAIKGAARKKKPDRPVFLQS
ncbi:MAG: tRNA uridine-5-carboxymethylaminomethyl(34) synthesis enzyme MnmG [Thermodesulfobacteriota bacterium]|nr:tRNA uridine-5-carboxymethylaminomethyl(34) synthesis enzyme MnmG [Thermodesulfobacteriota bacterium]